MREVAIIDYGAGNIGSIVNAIEYLNYKPVIIKNPSKKSYSHLILPGVGSFGKLSINLEKLSLKQYIYESLKKGSYLFGICIGMQLLFEKSEESPDHKGLSLIEGNLKKFHLKIDLIYLATYRFSKVSNKSSKLFHNLKKTLFFILSTLIV